MKKITDAKIRSLKPKSKNYRINVAERLFLEVRKNGKKFWRYRYKKNNGKYTMKSLGEYPHILLADAKKKAGELTERLEKGLPIDGINSSFGNLFYEWLEKQDYEETTKESKIRIFEKDIAPYLGKIDVNDITPQLLIACFKRIENRKAYEIIKKAKIICNKVFEYAIALGITDRNPVSLIGGALPSRAERNFPAITNPTDLKRLIELIDNYHGTYIVKLALKFLLYTFGRPGMVRFVEWDEIDFENKVWNVPAEKMKGRKGKKRPHIVPLSDQVVEILKKAHAISGHISKYVFPSPINMNKPLSENTLNTALRRMGISNKELVSHGFRHIASTFLHEMGFPSLVIEKQLAHTDKNKVRQVYNKAEYLSMRKELMQFWADYLDELKFSDRPFIKRIKNSFILSNNIEKVYVSA
ncbi:DUF4102 domain-containing protein [Deferribacter autotrophicus]|uniref:DUF4102 domain-containing protein n=1 Tax=Deferribacter autotrophicus TaxID=500465 RepID=A0A5A8F7N3_9BACT|nr:tyrosine-type recombinase/integrase [Deferribacter autotrophicus]KAA0259078.1 DUF4102 domain-containing protein [Deferribacter autotrophicus]